MADDRVALDSSFRVTVKVGDVDLGEADAQSGGAATASIPKTVRGAQLDMVQTLPHRRDHDDVTFDLKFVAATSLELERWLLLQCGLAPVVLARNPMIGGVPQGSPLVYSGATLTKVEPPQYSNDSSSVAVIRCTASGGKWA